MANSRQKTGKTPTRANASRSVGPGRNGTVVGALGILLALWLLYGTVTIHPFLWGTFAEELIAALCVCVALRLLCIANLPKRLIAVCLILLPAGIILYGAYAAVSLNAYFYRYLCLAGTAAFVLLVARLLDGRPDGVVLTALLLLAALPVLSTADTQFTHELMRLFLTAGVFFSVVSIREKTVWMAFCSAVLLGVAGIAGLYAAFVAAGTAAGLLLASPKRQRGVSWLVAALAVGLSLAGFALAKQYLPSSSVLFLANAVRRASGGVSENAPHACFRSRGLPAGDSVFPFPGKRVVAGRVRPARGTIARWRLIGYAGRLDGCAAADVPDRYRIAKVGRRGR
jgi:hypothetical protein